jgi:hypothetical protein
MSFRNYFSILMVSTIPAAADSHYIFEYLGKHFLKTE